MFSDLGLECTNGAYYYVTGINYGYNDSETMLNNLKKYIESHNHIVVGPDIEGSRPYCVPALCLRCSHSQYVGRRIRGQGV